MLNHHLSQQVFISVPKGSCRNCAKEKALNVCRNNNKSQST